MKNEERAAFLLDKYGDELYKFAFILTGADGAASEVFRDAFAFAAGKKTFTNEDDPDKRLLFSIIYKLASKRKTEGYKEEYGKKSDTFYEMLSLPLCERAVNHLVLYEDLTEKEAKEVINNK